MANEAGKNERRLLIAFWDGTNAAVDKVLAKKEELLHTENARSETIGAIEKRAGQTVLGTNTSGGTFHARDNYGMAFVQTSRESVNGLYRLSGSGEPYTTYTVSVNEVLYCVDYVSDVDGVLNTGLNIYVGDDVTLTEVPMYGNSDSYVKYLDNTDYSDVNIYKYSASGGTWNKMSSALAQNLAGGQFASAVMDGRIFFVNGRTKNLYIDSNGTDVYNSSSGVGDLHNSPRAKIINGYKGRLYLANYDWNGVHYGTTVLMSSPPLGIVSLIQEDVLAAVATVWTLPVTDSTYLYSDAGADLYEVWRINTKVADIQVSSVNDLNITVNNADIDWDPGMAVHTFLSQDQIHIKNTVVGAKAYRWPNNPTLSGQDVKQYSTFKLTGNDESDITMVENVGNIMLVGNRSSLATWNDSAVSYFDLGIGSVSLRGYTKAYGALYFLHYTGIYATSGGMPNIISTPVKPYIEGATKTGLESAAAGKKGRSVFFAIGDVTLYNADGSVKKVLRDTCLEYHITQQNWYVHTNVPASQLTSFMDELDPNRLLFSDAETKKIKAFLEGDSDDGDEIFFRIDTNLITIAPNFEELSNPQLVIIESTRGSSMECFISIDGDEYYPLEGTAEKGTTRIKVHGKDGSVGSPPIGHEVSLSLRDGSSQRCKVGRVAITFVPAGTSNPQ